MVLQCPRCGKTYDGSNLPPSQVLFRCTDPACRKIFAIPREDAPAAEGAAPASPPPPAEPARAEDSASQEAAKSLAQDYFADIPALAEKPGAAVQDEETPPETADAQRAELLHMAQEAAQSEAEDAEESETEETFTGPVRRRREKRGQRVVCRILQFLSVLLMAGRIVLTRQAGQIALFSRMQAQMIPSALYLCAALILLHRLLRRTVKPQWFAAVLLPLPLALDAWYLLPAPIGGLTDQNWLLISGGAKALLSLLALLMSVRAGKHPAKKHLKVEA